MGLDETDMIVSIGQLLISEGWTVVQRAQLGTDERGETYVAELAVYDEFLASWSTHGATLGSRHLSGAASQSKRLLGWACWRARRRPRSRLRGLSIAQVRAAVGYVTKHRNAA